MTEAKAKALDSTERGSIIPNSESPTGDSYDVRDPVLAVLIDVQRRKLDNLGALYRIRRLVARGWPYREWETR